MKTAKKAMLLTVCALVLVAATVMGTMAFLTDKDAVTNTFIAGKLVEKDEDFVLDESEYKRNADTGAYVATGDRTQANEYTVVPGKNLPKDPQVSVKVKENAYLYLEVVNTLPAGMTFEIDGTKWVPLQDKGGHDVVKGNNKIYVPVTGMLKPSESATVIQILKDNVVKVTDSFDPSTLTVSPEGVKNTLAFNAYLIQATSETYSDEFGGWNALLAELGK